MQCRGRLNKVQKANRIIESLAVQVSVFGGSSMNTAPKISDSGFAARHDKKSSLLKVGSFALYVIFGIITLVQLFFLIKDEMMTTKLYTEMRRVPTMSMDPPLIASICVKPSHSQDELEKAGYSDYLMFYTGYGGDENAAQAAQVVQGGEATKTLLSWSGYGEAAFTDPSKLLDAVLLWKKLSDFVSELIILTNGDWRVLTDKKDIDDLVQETNHYVSQYCFTLRSDFLSKTSSVEIQFANKASLEVEILLRDAGIFSRRTILEHSTNYRGTKVGTKIEASANRTLVKDFIVEVSQEAFAEEDVTKNCSIYPNDWHRSYGECDTAFTLTTLANNFGPDFRPLWIEKNVSKVTSMSYAGDLTPTPYYNLMLGIQLSDCKLPCTITRTYTQEVGEYTRTMPGVKVTFVKDMEVTETSVVPFSIVDLFSGMGGILGLWLGLGAIQLGELLLQLFGKIG